MPVVGSTAFATAQECFALIRSLLNDADLPSTLNITPTGAVRASNIVTITTSLAHGLVIGDRVNISSVTDVSFNGTQTVASVPTSTTFTYSQTAANASSGNGLVEIIIQGDVFTDTALLPLVNAAYRKLQRRLLMGGSPTMIAEIDLSLAAAGVKSITDTTTPQLPVDFLAPRQLFERLGGTTNRFLPMTGPVDALPDIPQSTYLGYWSWREDGIYFIGATQLIDVRVRYSRTIVDLVSKDSQILIRGGLDPVAYWAAAGAAASKGASAPQWWAGAAEDTIAEMKTIQAHARQFRTARRRPYGGHAR